MKDQMIRNDYRVDVGRADRGRTFVRVVHLPTGKDRILIGLEGADPGEVALRLTRELESEIAAEQRGRNPPSDLLKT